MVSHISNLGGRVATPPPPIPEDAFKKIDSANKGYITKSEVASAIVQLSPEGARISQVDAQSIASDAFKEMDADSDGKVTQSEFKAASKNPAFGGPPSDRPSGPPPGPPPGGGSGGPAGTKGADAASSSQSYDPADANKDGTVSELERLAYDSKQQATDASTKNNYSNSAVSAYRSVGNNN